jgi:hypothetical protein
MSHHFHLLLREPERSTGLDPSVDKVGGAGDDYERSLHCVSRGGESSVCGAMVRGKSRTVRAEAEDPRAADEEDDGLRGLVEFARFAGAMFRPVGARNAFRTGRPKALRWASMRRTVGAI